MTVPNRPKSLADPAALAHRRTLLAAAHLAPLAPYLASVRAAHGEVPDPDPLDGGAGARLLLLLETPGPRIGRSGIVSRDNPTGTAANLFGALAEAGIARRDTLIWNAVPWVIHAPGALNRAPRRGEIAAGLATLPGLLDVLPNLAAVVLAGRVAGMAAPMLADLRSDLPLLAMPHPSPTYLCTSPTHPARIREVLAEAARWLSRADRHPSPFAGQGRTGGWPERSGGPGGGRQGEVAALDPGRPPPPAPPREGEGSALALSERKSAPSSGIQGR